MNFPHARLALSLVASTLAIAASLPGAAQARDLVVPREVVAQQERIRLHEDAGKVIGAIIVAAPDVEAQAALLAASGLPLAGRTVLVKDNVETREWATTAGSLALVANDTKRDAPIIARLRAAGGVVSGKANLSEWANIRSTRSTSGWSAVGGLTRNPHAPVRNPCGSSSGSGAAVAAGFAWAAIGTETDGSITCPASVNGVVGLKPTVGLVSRAHIVPISSSQDTAGPMARSVRDAALLLSAIAGSDPLDPATKEADAHRGDFTAGLDTATLQGVRIGVLRAGVGSRKDVAALFDAALADMRRAGAELVEIDWQPDPAMGAAEYAVLLYELRETMDAYLSTSPAPIPVRSLADVIALNTANADRELEWFGQEIFEQAVSATDREAYLKARADSLRMAKTEGLEKLMADNRVAALIAPTAGPAWTSDLVNGDNYASDVGMGSIAAIGGTPHLSVPMGAVHDLPIGLSFMGPAWSDHLMLKLGAAYERARTATLPVAPMMGAEKVE